MAVVVIGGVITSMLVTLLAVPALATRLGLNADAEGRVDDATS
jgi:Cu/Ag efflux pump CusA